MPRGLPPGRAPAAGTPQPRTRVCWHCGSGLPPDVARLHLPAAGLRRMMCILLEGRGELVRYEQLGKSRMHVQVNMCRIRSAIREQGLDWVIHSRRGLGYVLQQRKRSRGEG
jgi:hypothetical protein